MGLAHRLPSTGRALRSGFLTCCFCWAVAGGGGEFCPPSGCGVLLQEGAACVSDQQLRHDVGRADGKAAPPRVPTACQLHKLSAVQLSAVPWILAVSAVWGGGRCWLEGCPQVPHSVCLLRSGLPMTAKRWRVSSSCSMPGHRWGLDVAGRPGCYWADLSVQSLLQLTALLLVCFISF